MPVGVCVDADAAAKILVKNWDCWMGIGGIQNWKCVGSKESWSWHLNRYRNASAVGVGYLDWDSELGGSGSGSGWDGYPEFAGLHSWSSATLVGLGLGKGSMGR
jgi:hypothetical protein